MASSTSVPASSIRTSAMTYPSLSTMSLTSTTWAACSIRPLAGATRLRSQACGTGTQIATQGCASTTASEMRTSRFRGTALAMSWVLLLWLTGPLACAAAPQSEQFTKPRVLVLTDIGNEPDDSESMVRLLLYANELDIEGLVATTSTWLKDKVHPELIEERVRAYGEVLPNLRVHAEGYPDAAGLMSLIRSGRPVYGMRQVGPGWHTPASDLIIAALKRPDPRPLWIS